MKPLYIIFTGGCHSGKTTSIQTIKKILEKRGKKVFIFSEIIRGHNIGSIDDIRSDANKYMDLQNQIINEKIDMELSLTIPSYENEIDRYNSVVLVDRAITDSLFYLTFYTNKNGFNEESKEKFFNTYNRIKKHLDNITNVYDYIFEFKPLQNITEDDSFRPKSLDKMKEIEYNMIHTYNKYYFGQYERYHEIDLNDIPLEDMEKYWEEHITEFTNGEL